MDSRVKGRSPNGYSHIVYKGLTLQVEEGYEAGDFVEKRGRPETLKVFLHHWVFFHGCVLVPLSLGHFFHLHWGADDSWGMVVSL